MKIADATALVTGASQGLGRCLATHLASCGARVFLTARNGANLEAVCDAIRQAGGECRFRPSDLRDAASLEALADEIQREWGRVDLLVNNAADVTSKPLLDTSLGEIEALVATNVTGCIQLTRLIAPMMVEGGRGVIVNISSLAGCKPNPTQTVYSVTKTAVNGFSEALRAELKQTPIRVINVPLSSVAVSGAPKPGQVSAEDVVRRIEHAIQRECPELYFSLVTKWLMRIYQLFPGLMRLR